MASLTIAANKADLAGYDTGPDAIRFQPDDGVDKTYLAIRFLFAIQYRNHLTYDRELLSCIPNAGSTPGRTIIQPPMVPWMSRKDTL